MPQDGAPPTSVDVLAAQVRAGLIRGEGCCHINDAAWTRESWEERMVALDALVARVTEVERREHGLNDDWLAASERAAKAEAALADARNALERMYDAANGWDMSLSSWCDGRERDQLREAMIGAREVLARLDGSSE